MTKRWLIQFSWLTQTSIWYLMQYDFHFDYDTQNGANESGPRSIDREDKQITQLSSLIVIITQRLKMINSAAWWTLNLDKQGHAYTRRDTESSGKDSYMPSHAFKKRLATGLLFFLLFWKKIKNTNLGIHDCIKMLPLSLGHL